MWRLDMNPDRTFILVYDRGWKHSSLRGLWEIVGKQGSTYTEYCVKVNRAAGHLCVNDDEGNVRVLVLTE